MEKISESQKSADAELYQLYSNKTNNELLEEETNYSVIARIFHSRNNIKEYLVFLRNKLAYGLEHEKTVAYKIILDHLIELDDEYINEFVNYNNIELERLYGGICRSRKEKITNLMSYSTGVYLGYTKNNTDSTKAIKEYWIKINSDIAEYFSEEDIKDNIKYCQKYLSKITDYSDIDYEYVMYMIENRIGNVIENIRTICDKNVVMKIAMNTSNKKVFNECRKKCVIMNWNNSEIEILRCYHNGSKMDGVEQIKESKGNKLLELAISFQYFIRSNYTIHDIIDLPETFFNYGLNIIKEDDTCNKLIYKWYSNRLYKKKLIRIEREIDQSGVKSEIMELRQRIMNRKAVEMQSGNKNRAEFITVKYETELFKKDLRNTEEPKESEQTVKSENEKYIKIYDTVFNFINVSDNYRDKLISLLENISYRIFIKMFNDFYRCAKMNNRLNYLEQFVLATFDQYTIKYADVKKEFCDIARTSKNKGELIKILAGSVEDISDLVSDHISNMHDELIDAVSEGISRNRSIKTGKFNQKWDKITTLILLKAGKIENKNDVLTIYEDDRILEEILTNIDQNTDDCINAKLVRIFINRGSLDYIGALLISRINIMKVDKDDFGRIREACYMDVVRYVTSGIHSICEVDQNRICRKLLYELSNVFHSSIFDTVVEYLNRNMKNINSGEIFADALYKNNGASYLFRTFAIEQININHLDEVGFSKLMHYMMREKEVIDLNRTWIQRNKTVIEKKYSKLLEKWFKNEKIRFAMNELI
ncbi:hypothetical protein ECANGB1_1899 [Enterospora canceri]|uniref:Uncharacterized protein n=1 Tax=Enterospora canceri TaxID=1081671 RepID=A0A1Y1S910_9MICR|nr:hypothetical protein ECANGB1_1899 [Enterospora canceri]